MPSITLPQATTSDVKAQLVAAFGGAVFGALLTYIFNRVYDAQKARTERLKKHFSGLVEVEGMLVEIGTILHDNTYSLKGMITATKGRQVHYGGPKALPINHNYKLALLDVNLINKLMQFNSGLRKYNDDIQNVNESKAGLSNILMADGFTTEQATLQAYFGHMDDMIDQLVVPLILFSENQMEEIIRLSALMRLVTEKDMPKSNKNFVKKFGNRQIDEAIVDEKVLEIKAEIAEAQAVSNVEIDAFYAAMGRERPKTDTQTK